MKNKRLIIILACVPLLLLIPLIGMQFSNEVNWSYLDFILAGLLLTGIGLCIETTLRCVKSVKYRIIICLIVFMIFFLIWAELAVGIFNSPVAGT